ncbi:hypothetical protein [Streptomyces sp. MA15]|uniref:hypothetical protein n=1 Tax=Streptomyces sp. MA15 TaxID=3055061 RepID=UPI0025B1100F|nr:hypothetical protein [Streptomyces sp. MA15]MDN3270842.1 hypothetical protein [Streptomyces sp. MA15]
METGERDAPLCRHPLPELRLIAEGPRLRVHHDGREAGTMVLERPEAAQGIRGVAGRHGAARPGTEDRGGLGTTKAQGAGVHPLTWAFGRSERATGIEPA